MADEIEENPPIDNSRAAVFLTEVAACRRVSPAMVEVTLRGEDLRQFPDIGPDAFVYVFVPRPGEEDHRVTHEFTWDKARTMTEDEKPIGRYYTVRRLRTEAGELDLYMVLHGDGPLSTWASGVSVGRKVALWGPRAAFKLPTGVSTVFIAADETGLPAAGAILDSLPPDATGTAIIEIAGGSERQELRRLPGISIQWVARDGAPYGQRLAQAVRAATIPSDAYCWAGSCHTGILEIRKELKRRGFPSSQQCILTYWREGERR